MNMPNTSAAMDLAQSLEDKLAKGDQDGLNRAFAALGDAISSVQDMLEGEAEAFNTARFSEEKAALGELMDEIASLESDERILSGETQGFAEVMKTSQAEQEQTENASRRARTDMLLKEAKGLEKDVDGLKPFVGQDAFALEEWSTAHESTQRLSPLVEKQDLSEAALEAMRVASGLEALGEALSGDPHPDDPQVTNRDLEQIERPRQRAVALAELLEAQLPSRLAQMNGPQRRQAEQLSERQAAIEAEVQKLAQKADALKSKVPGVAKAKQALKRVAKTMRRTADRLDKGGADDAAAASRQAADQLAQLRQELGKNRSMNQRGQERSPQFAFQTQMTAKPRASGERN